MERNHLSYDEVNERMDKQLDENMKMKLCDFVIYNDEQHLLIPQIHRTASKTTQFVKSKIIHEIDILLDLEVLHSLEQSLKYIHYRAASFLPFFSQI